MKINTETVIIINNGKLYNLICDSICDDFLKKENIKNIIFQLYENDETILVRTDLGKTIILDNNDLRKYQLKYYIDKYK
jgi:hypothetical protein